MREFRLLDQYCARCFYRPKCAENVTAAKSKALGAAVTTVAFIRTLELMYSTYRVYTKRYGSFPLGRPLTNNGMATFWARPKKRELKSGTPLVSKINDTARIWTPNTNATSRY
jgi:hypothetical protein